MVINLYVYLVVILVYNLYNFLRDLPFYYITQTDYALCKYMNNSYCVRISYLVMAILVYLVTIEFINKTLPREYSKVANAITNDRLNNVGFGSLIGGGVALVCYILNLAFRFSVFNGFKRSLGLVNFATILAGMTMTSVSEELIYRGLLIGVTKEFLNPYICVLLSALAFGYVHVQYSLKYGISAFVSGIVLGIGYLYYGLYWSVGFHALFNFIETSLYTSTKIKVGNTFMVGERKTPDDDGMMTPIVELIGLLVYYFGYV